MTDLLPLPLTDCSQSDIDVKMVIENWLKKVSADLQDSLRSFVNTFLYKGMDTNTT